MKLIPPKSKSYFSLIIYAFLMSKQVLAIPPYRKRYSLCYADPAAELKPELVFIEHVYAKRQI
jgi:hypothetical protein